MRMCYGSNVYLLILCITCISNLQEITFFAQPMGHYTCIADQAHTALALIFCTKKNLNFLIIFLEITRVEIVPTFFKTVYKGYDIETLFCCPTARVFI